MDGREYLAFCSNDYLGLANHPQIVEAAVDAARRHGVGEGASHLLSGHSVIHERLESALARFLQLPRALLFSSGYQANIGAITALAGPEDVVFSDALNHASLIDGARLSRARVIPYPHVDLDFLSQALAKSDGRTKLIVTDGVFSMDGDIAPLPGLLELCERHDALLLLDDAHGFGVIGAGGRGSPAHFGVRSSRIVYVGTLGKAAGVSGAFVAGAPEIVELVLQRARTYIYTTAAPAMLSAAIEASLRLTYSIALIAGLAFLGLSPNPNGANWGTMIQQNEIVLAVQPWGAAAPIIVIALLTLGTGLIGDGIARTAAGIDRARGEE